MKVAIDSGPLSSGHSIRGIGVHTRELIDAFVKIKNKSLTVEPVDFSKADLSRFDLAHFTSFKPYLWSLPLTKPCRKIILTIHDLIPLVYPAAYPSGIKGRFRFEVQKFLLGNFDAIITISETSKKDICRFLPIPPDSVHVIYLAPRKIFRRITNTSLLYSIEVKYKLPKKFALYVNDINYNKNLVVLADACKLARVPLVIVGKQATNLDVNWENVENKPFRQFLDKYGNDKEIMKIGFVPDEDLIKIYNLASVFCLPSLYEGFGLQTLEAMACGCPVVASRIQAHVEINGDAVCYADPKSPEDFAGKIQGVIRNKEVRDKLINLGLKKAKEYSWEKTAQGTIEVYKELLG